MKNSRISEKILLGACRILLEWERTYANLDECIDHPIPVFLPGEFHGLCSPWGPKELDTTE